MYAILQARLSLGYEVYPRAPRRSVWNETCKDGRLPHLPLLQTLPTVRMRQHNFDAVLHGSPDTFTRRVGVHNISLRAREEVTKEVCEHLQDRLSKREWWQIASVHFLRVETFWT